jgi:hypothetical protein
MNPQEYVPKSPTLVILFQSACARLLASSRYAELLTNARLVLLTEEINRISDEIYEFSSRVAAADVGQSGPIKSPGDDRRPSPT